MESQPKNISEASDMTTMFLPFSSPSVNLGREGSVEGSKDDCEVVSVEGVRLRFSQKSLPRLRLRPQLP